MSESDIVFSTKNLQNTMLKQPSQASTSDRRLLLVPSTNNGICAQTMETAAALRQDGFQVDIADAAAGLSVFLLKSLESKQSFQVVVMGLGESPAEDEIDKLRIIWRHIPEALIIACAAEFSDAWETKAKKLRRGGQLFLLDNPVETRVLRRTAASLFGVWESREIMRRKLERMEHTVASCAHEISRRKEAEQEACNYATAVENSNRALEEFCAATEAAAKAKSEFLANMSHEIRTPLTAILGFSEELLEAGLAEKERIAAATTIQRNGRHLLSIINDILDVSKIEAGKMEIEHIECSPKQLVDDVYALMEENARRKHLYFEVFRFGNIPEIIESDPTRIRQILINLVGNAIKFTSHGTVKLSYGVEEGANGAAAVFFEVGDTGIGMSDAHMDRLFVPFSQADSSTTRRFGGSGLGLSICKHLIDKLGGHIAVESRLGEGSTFRVSIPIGDPNAVKSFDEESPCDKVAAGKNRGAVLAADSPPPYMENLSKLHILVAEDAPDNQRLIRMILEKAGAQVDMACNGLEAVETATVQIREKNPHDLILMDIQMPILDGYRATIKLRENGYSGPIIALTAHAMGAEVERIIEAGCTAYLAKPFTRCGLLSAIGRVVKERVNQSSGLTL